MSDGAAPPTGACLVALPTRADPVNGLSQEDQAHITLLWLGDAAELTPDVTEGIRRHIEQVVMERGEFTVKVNGRAVLGDDDAGVLLIESLPLMELRDSLFEDPSVQEAYLQADQFPAFIPHLTLTYGGGLPSGDLPTEIQIDSVGLWLGGQHESFQLRLSSSPSDDPNFRTDYGDELSASIIPPVLSLDDLPLCVRFADDNCDARWYASRMAAAYGVPDLIPAKWFITDATP